MKDHTRTPRIARRILRMFTPADVRDSIDGDLAELHAERQSKHGKLSAHAWYWREAMSISVRFALDAITRVPKLVRSIPTAFSSLDFRLSARLLLKNPGLTLISGFGIAAAIGITAGMFAFINFNIAPKIPLEEGDRIVALENWNVAINNEARQSTQDFISWRQQMKSVVDISAFRNIRAVIETGPASAEDITIAGITATGFRVARVQPLLGRVLVPEDEVPGKPSVLIIGYDVWRTRFAGDPLIIGRQVRINDAPFTVIGVMPRDYGFPVNHQYWSTLLMDPSTIERGRGPEMFVFGRLAASATMQSARAEFASIGRRAAADFPQTNGQLRANVWSYTAPLLDIQGNGWGDMWPAQLALSLVVIVVALNVAILVFARTAVRRSEIAVRTALGASRRRIVGQLFVEAIALSLPPAILGLALAHYGLKLGSQGLVYGVNLLGGKPPFWMDISIQPSTAVFALGLALVVATIVGVLPALQATGKRVQGDLRQLGGATGLRLGKMWTVLIVAQVAFAVAILPPALKNGLLSATDSFTRPTYPAEDFLSGTLSVKRTNVQTSQPTPLFGARIDDVVRNLRANPSVMGVTFRGGAPVGATWGGRIELDGIKIAIDIERRVRPQGVDTAYFNVYGAGLQSGRLFESSDLASSTHSVIVNRAFVRRVLNNKNALGVRLRYVPQVVSDTTTMPPWFEIVGVIDDLRRNSLDPNAIAPSIYHPFVPDRTSGVNIVIRTRGVAPTAFVKSLHNAIAAASAEVRLSDLAPGTSVDPESKAIMEIIGTVLTLVLSTVLLLSAGGVYALMSFTVSQRRREIGIRAALGASQRQVLVAVFSRVAKQIATGVVIGAIIAAVLDRVTGRDAAVETFYIVPFVAVVMVIVGLCAAFVPTKRGLAIQPVEALRGE